MSDELKPGQCSACGALQGHEQDCPATEVRVTDKRAEKRAAADLRRLAAEAEAARSTAEDVDVVISGDNKVIACRFCTPVDGEHAEEAAHPQDMSTRQEEITEPPVVLEDGELTARQQRIEELKTKGRESKLEEDEAAELLRLQAAEEEGRSEDDVWRGQTAFLVLIGHDGTAHAESNVNILMELERIATVDDMDAGCHIVNRDIQASMTAKQVVFGLQVSANAMAGQQRAQQMAQRAMQGMGGRGLRR